MIDGTDPSLTAAAAAPSPRRWIIKKANKPSGGSPTTPTSPAVVVDTETDDSFDQKVELWARKRFSKRLAYHLCQDVHKDMQRRKQAQQGQQGQQLHQEQQQQQQEVLSSVNTTPDQQPDKQNTLFDLRAFDFQSPKQLAGRDYDMWIDHAHRDMHQPHQWLRLASLFHIHPKSQHQRSILDGPLRIASQIDRNVSRKVNDTPLEHYLALRQTQNRAYAIQAVSEGAKAFEANQISEARTHYQRATDMDPTYPEAWFRVAEYLLHEKNQDGAINNLKRTLKLDPMHEKAKNLLLTLENTTEYMTTHGNGTRKPSSAENKGNGRSSRDREAKSTKNGNARSSSPRDKDRRGARDDDDASLGRRHKRARSSSREKEAPPTRQKRAPLPAQQFPPPPPGSQRRSPPSYERRRSIASRDHSARRPRSPSRDRDHERARERENERHRDRNQERARERDRERDVERAHERDHERGRREREKEHERHRERDRERDRDHKRHRDASPDRKRHRSESSHRHHHHRSSRHRSSRDNERERDRRRH